MFNYARSDTHFLLYVYDILRNELLEKSEPSKPEGDLIDTVLRKSKEEALQRYERPFYDAQRGTGPSGWYNILSYTPALLSRQQFAVFRAVHHWRDIIARQEDESLNTIMPKHVIYNIAREMPMEMAALLGCSQPISTFVRFRAGELLGVIKQAKIEGTTGPDMMEVFRTADPSNSDSVEVTVPVIEAAVAVVPSDTSSLGFRSGTPTSSKLAQSSFWGATLNSNFGGNGADSELPGADSICLALPLPQLTAEVFADPDTMKSANTHYPNLDQGARAEHAYVKERKAKEEEIFIVKHVGGPKKRKAAELEDPVGPPEPVLVQERKAPTMDGTVEDDLGHGICLNGVDGEPNSREKVERKAERKAQKKLEKNRRKLEERQQAHKLEEEAAFDYASAPSILHAKEANRVHLGEKEAFNPYSKSLDAPKGMRHNKKEMPGKSVTFRS